MENYYVTQIIKYLAENKAIEPTELLEYLVGDLYNIASVPGVFSVRESQKVILRKMLIVLTRSWETKVPIKDGLTEIFREMTVRDVSVHSCVGKLLLAFVNFYPDYISILSADMIQHYKPVPYFFQPEVELFKLVGFLETDDLELKYDVLDTIEGLVPLITPAKISTRKWDQIIGAFGKLLADRSENNVTCSSKVIYIVERLLTINLHNDLKDWLLQLLINGLNHPTGDVIALCVEKFLLYCNAINDKKRPEKLIEEVVSLLKLNNVDCQNLAIEIIKNNSNEIPINIRREIIKLLTPYLYTNTRGLRKSVPDALSHLEFSCLLESPATLQDELYKRFRTPSDHEKYFITLRVIKLLIMHEAVFFAPSKLYFIKLLACTRFQEAGHQIFALKILAKIVEFIPAGHPDIAREISQTLIMCLTRKNRDLYDAACDVLPKLASLFSQQEKASLFSHFEWNQQNITYHAGIIPDSLKGMLLQHILALDRVFDQQVLTISLTLNEQFHVPKYWYPEATKMYIKFCKSDNHYFPLFKAIEVFAEKIPIDQLPKMIEALLIIESASQDYNAKCDLIRVLTTLVLRLELNVELTAKVVNTLKSSLSSSMHLIAHTAARSLNKLERVIDLSARYNLIDELSNQITKPESSERINENQEDILEVLHQLYPLSPEPLKRTVLVHLLDNNKYIKAQNIILAEKDFDYRPNIVAAFLKKDAHAVPLRLDLITNMRMLYQEYITNAVPHVLEMPGDEEKSALTI